MSAAAPVLQGFDPGPEIRRSVRGQERHRPRLRRTTLDLARFARLDDHERARALEPRLAALRASLWRSPYYCRVLRERGLAPEDLGSLEDLRHFPLLERDTLRQAFAEIPALPARRRVPRLLVESSSGSSGQPVTVLKEDYDSVHMWAVLRFWMARLGLRLPARPRIALVCTLPHGVEYRTPLPALAGTLERISLARPDPGARLRAFRPDVVFTDPAGLHWLAGQQDPWQPRLLLSSAMHLPPELRHRVTAKLATPVLNYYSCAETGPLAWECLAAPGRFHVLLPDAFVESVAGELVVTRLRESVLPLLRYRTGDAGRVEPEACACGLRGFSIVGLSGRRACRFATPDGRTVDAWRLAWVFQHHPLDGFRLTQEAPEQFRLETAGDPPEGAARLVERLHATLVALGWPTPRIEHARVARETLAADKPEPFHSSGRPPSAPRGISGNAGLPLLQPTDHATPRKAD
jgi:phenylacetate-CoA ligase